MLNFFIILLRLCCQHPVRHLAFTTGNNARPRSVVDIHTVVP